MIDLASTAQAIARHLPSPLPAPATIGVPDISPLVPLARYLSTRPDPAMEAHRIVSAHAGDIAAITRDAAPLFISAALDITEIGASFLRRAVPLAATALIPGAGTAHAVARLAVEVSSHLAQAALRVQQLTQDLAPFTGRLSEIAARVVQLPNGPGMLSPRSGPVPEHEIKHVALSAELPAGGSSGGAAGSSAGSAAVAAAKSTLGTPYVWGGTSPGGFDCSGLTQWAWRQAGVDLPRTAEMQAVGRPVSAEELQEGDLVVWDGHVAMYAGGGTIIEAGDPVQINPLRTSNMGMSFKGFYRPTG
ncbi:C40 family peptidase [Corynebacterium renale]|uniref:NlpC/P60 family protein n=1 Tax=Corynebacterium renale TaxID=1724 RepID=A0A2A9DKJ4_9CORY|nr:C40 family peptidase [Corynebacterium renale]PFG27133.1 NlpC/P60 family protein [Corynebacterium renale]SQI24052.1 cell wall-associated hydrolase [Corynebacterium renale]